MAIDFTPHGQSTVNSCDERTTDTFNFISWTWHQLTIKPAWVIEDNVTIDLYEDSDRDIEVSN